MTKKVTGKDLEKLIKGALNERGMNTLTQMIVVFVDRISLVVVLMIVLF